MQNEITTQARIAALKEEIQTIDFANKLYWRQRRNSSVATAEYYRRQERLEEIRTELYELTKTSA
jgi:hypothetical protein